jgi:hypothetical protein
MSPYDEADLRNAMLDYCRRDTLALIDVYQSLRELAGGHKRAPSESGQAD